MWYDPEPVGKPHSLAKELVKCGHSVTVITNFPNYPDGKIYPGYQSKRFLYIQRKDNVRIIRVRSILDRSRNVFRRLTAMISYSLIAFTVSSFLGETFDAVWSYQVGFPGTIYSVLYNTPHIHEVQDLWPGWGENTLEGFSAIVSQALMTLQKYIYSQARILTTISNGFQKTLVSNYATRKDKITIIPNWADNDAFDCRLHREASRVDFDLPNGLLVTYGGNVGTAQGLQSLVDASVLLEDKLDVHIVIAGEGMEKACLQQYVKEKNIRNIIFLPAMSPKTMGALLAVSDWLYISLGSQKKYEITIPSKTYAYLSAGKPIIAAANGDVADFILENNIGLVTEPNCPAKIASTLQYACFLNSDVTKEMGDRAYSLSKTKYNGSILGKQYSELFETFLRS